MNLAVRGLAANFGEFPADTFFKDQHPDLKADFIMANPPFNLKDWRAENELTSDSRWNGYDTPPTGNANYAWILHMVSKLSANGVAGFVLANGSMSSNQSGEGKIRQKLLENDLVDCMIALPGQLFYTTQIPVCLWFLAKNKKAHGSHRDRQGQTLFIDARKIGTMISRTQKELTSDDTQGRLDPGSELKMSSRLLAGRTDPGQTLCDPMRIGFAGGANPDPQGVEQQNGKE